MNTSFIIGAIGEEKVIETLRKLPDSYYVLNEIQIKLSRSVLWRKYLEYIKSAQIDHIVIGPTGIFLIETKNWDEMNITSVHTSPPNRLKEQERCSGLPSKEGLAHPLEAITWWSP